MKRIIQHIIGYGLLILSPAWLQAQVLAKASVDRDNILIGEPITLTLDVRVPLGLSVDWFRLDTIPHFEFLTKGNVDTVDGIDGKKIQQVLTITSFDSGYWQIPAFTIQIDNKTYYTDTLGVTVSFAAFNHDEDYKDIKEIVEVQPPWWLKYIPWLIGVVTLVAIGLVTWLLRKRKQVVTVEQQVVVSKLSPYEEALLGLEELRKKGWTQNGEVKAYYSRLNDILRVFVLRKLNIASLEKTNEELIVQLRKLSLEKDSFQQLATALRMADFVKFARYQPDASDNEKNFIVIQSAITTLNNIS
jgi:BatD DUF11 like domain